MLNMLQCAFHPVRYPLNIGYHGKASRVRMVDLWARPWLGSIFSEFGLISIDLQAVLDVVCFLCFQSLARRDGVRAAHRRADDGSLMLCRVV